MILLFLLLLVIGYFGWTVMAGVPSLKTGGCPGTDAGFSVSENDAGKALEAGTLRYNGKTYAY